MARVPRASVMLSALVEGFGGKAVTKHRVRDLSAGGVRIDQAGDLRVGASVIVSVGALDAVGATVVWVAEGSAGLAFAERIDPEKARMRTAIAPRTTAKPHAAPPGIAQPAKGPAMPPTSAAAAAAAGWIADLYNPYRR